MGFACFVATIVLYILIGSSTAEKMVPRYDAAKEEYMKSIARDIKKFAISKEDIKDIDYVSGNSNVVRIFWGWAIGTFILAFIVCVFVAGNTINDSSDDMPIIAVFSFYFVWAFVGIVGAYNHATNGVKERVFSAMEQYRCPHCHAPLGYTQVGSYRSDEQHYLKRVEKREGSVFDKNSFTYHTNVPMTSYVLHSVYQCYFCKIKDEKTHKIENETGSFCDNLDKLLK